MFIVALQVRLICLLVLCLFIRYQGSWKQHLKTLSARSAMCLYYWSVKRKRYKWDCWTYVLEDHLNETENVTVNLQKGLLIKTRETDIKLWNLVPSAIWTPMKQVSWKVNAYFGSAEWSESGDSTVKILQSRYKYIIIKWLYESGYVRRDEASNIALNPIPLLGRIIYIGKQS